MGAILALSLALIGPAPAMERVRVSDDARGFVLEPSRRAFVPWGLNYGNAGRLIEDYWKSDWPALASDFREMKDLGANVVRVHLQFGKFMDAPDRANPEALERLGKLLKLAEETGLYLDLTGLACYRKADVPPWYDGLSEEARWSAQAKFWSGVAEKCEPSPAVFCFDLINEPFAGGGGKKPGDWYSGKPFGGYDFVQWVAVEERGRTRDEIAKAWIGRMIAAIREHDRRHLITVGLLPWVPGWGFLSGFDPNKVAPDLDFISVHIYPEKGKVDEAIADLKRFAVGKPLVIEEIFPLACSAEELETFIEKSRPIARGWMGHYDGTPLDEMERLRKDGKQTMPQAIYESWQKLFRKLAPK